MMPVTAVTVAGMKLAYVLFASTLVESCVVGFLLTHNLICVCPEWPSFSAGILVYRVSGSVLSGRVDPCLVAQMHCLSRGH